jgi:hypothetical protein
MHLKRYFCESGEEDQILLDDVFIFSGEWWEEQFGQREKQFLPQTWERYSSARSIVLLGPPRQGKTTEFRYQCDQTHNGFFLSLGKIPTMAGFEVFAQFIENNEQWMAWRNGNERGELFIDSLDEGKLATPLLMRNLVAWLQSLGEHILSRLRVHLSCRGAEWDRADQDNWFNLFKFSSGGQQNGGRQKTVDVLVLLDLDRSQYEKYCQAHNVDPRQLFADLPIRGRRFVARPQTLRMIVEDYRQSGQPPEIITELYERVIGRRLGEENPEHQQASSIIPITNKRSVSESYAAITVLSDRPLIADQGVDSLNSVSMGIGGHAHNVEEATFNSGLFQAPIRGQYRFDDPELTNYLGACYLSGLINSGAISTHRALRLFLANPEEMEPIPKLRGMMVWLCALNPAFRRLAVKINPGILLDDFPVDLSVDDKLAAWNWLVNRYGDRRYFDYRPWIEGVKALACPEIVTHLKEVLENPGHYGRDIRVLALQISFAGYLTKLAPVIESCCTSLKDDPNFLIEAAGVLEKLSPERIEVIKPWLILSPKDDPNNRLLGSALKALWPDYLSIQEVVGFIRPPLTKDGSDGLSGFLYDLPDKLSPDDRAVVIDSMDKELEIILKKKDAKKPQQYSRHLPSQWIMKFLIPQINVWKNDPVHILRLEKWISVALRAGMLLSIYFPNREELLNLIEEDRNFRHSLEVARIERAIKEKGAEFDPIKHEVGEHYFPKAEDYPLWKETLLSWLDDGEPGMVKAAWYNLYASWNAAGNPSEFVIWVEELSSKNDLIRNLWDESKSWKMQDWHHEKLKREKEQRERSERNKESILANKELIAEGNLDLLVHLYNLSKYKEKSIKDEYGDEVANAYREGLLACWQNATLPALPDYYNTNRIPWLVLLIIGAINIWRHEAGASWDKISVPMRRVALQAGLSDLNKFPEWYEELIQIEAEAFLEIAFAALDLEARSETDYPALAHHIKHNASFELFRNIAFDYLKQNPALRSEVLIPLAEAQIVEKPSEGIVDFLWELGCDRLTNFGRHSGLRILALVWLYRAEMVWSWLNDNFLGIREARIECVRNWINAILDMHVPHRLGRWPALTATNALIALMPDYFAIYPPETDPTIEEINKNIPSIQHRSELANLRNDAMAKISESGSAEAGKFLAEWASDPERNKYRDHILYHFDRWRQATVEKSWQPLPPQDLMGLLTQGRRPVRTHDELYAFVLDMIGEIKAEIEGGQDNLKHLCWIFRNRRATAAAEETNLQIVLAREIRQHLSRSHIVGNREVSVTDENQPDLKIETRLENNQVAVIYIEVKRQLHQEVLTAIKSQLANKYLIDPQSRYGVYFVGWYGDSREFWTASQKGLRERCGDIPKTSEELEVCLQQIADEVVQKRYDIDKIKVVVVDLSLQSAWLR